MGGALSCTASNERVRPDRKALLDYILPTVDGSERTSTATAAVDQTPATNFPPFLFNGHHKIKPNPTAVNGRSSQRHQSAVQPNASPYYPTSPSHRTLTSSPKTDHWPTPRRFESPMDIDKSSMDKEDGVSGGGGCSSSSSSNGNDEQRRGTMGNTNNCLEEGNDFVVGIGLKGRLHYGLDGGSNRGYGATLNNAYSSSEPRLSLDRKCATTTTSASSSTTTATTTSTRYYGTLLDFPLRRNFKRKTMDRQQAPNKNQGGSWKFWRRLSFRSKHDPKPKKSVDKSSATTLLEKHDCDDVFETKSDVTSHSPTRALPDVVEKANALPQFNSNSVPPPKPPRNPADVNRNSSTEPNGETPRHGSQQEADRQNSNTPEPSYINCERVSELKSQVRTPNTNTNTNTNTTTNTTTNNNTAANPKLNAKQQAHAGENNNVLVDKSHLCILAEIEEEQLAREPDKGLADSLNNNSSPSTTPASSRKYPYSIHTMAAASVSPATARSKVNYAYQSSTTPRRPKIVTPELSLKRTGRSRRKSNEKGDVTRQRHIMNSVGELMCQRLDPYPLLDPLKRAGVLTNVNVQSFIGHHDRRSVCEGLADLIGSGQPDFLLTFCDILSMAGGNCTEILEVLQVMREMDRIIHDIPEANPDKSVMAEEKNINFDIGFLASDYSLKPLVELERVRMSGDKRLSKTSSRNSAYSLLETESDAIGGRTGGGDGTLYPGLVMMSISVTGHSLSGKRAEALAELIRHHNCISELHMGKTQIDGRDVEVIAKALVSDSTIHSLDLRLNSIGLRGAQAVAQLLQQTRFLRILNLSSSGLDTECFRVIASAVSGNKTLVELDASFLDINDESCRYLRDMLRSNSCLLRLRLRSNNLTWSGCYVLCEGLAKNMALGALDLSRNQIGDAGTQALAKYLPESSICELCVENCGIGTAGCESLAEVVSHCKRLKQLDMSTNDIMDTGVAKLAPALERTSSITHVSMNMCGVTNDGFSKLLDVLEKNTSIVHLKLCYNNLGKEQANLAATSDNLRYRLRIVTSSKPKLKILLWGNSFDDSS